MILTDVNVLVAAFKEEAQHHQAVGAWLDRSSRGGGSIGLVGSVVAGFVRIVTNPRIFTRPATIDQAIDFLHVLRSRAGVLTVHPSAGHLDAFENLCRAVRPPANLVPDVYLASIASDVGAVIATMDRDFARIPGVRWMNPLVDDA